MPDDRVLPEGGGRSLQLPSQHLPWVTPLLHLSPHIVAQRCRTPEKMLLLRVHILQQLIGPGGQVGGRPGAIPAMQTGRVVTGQGYGWMGRGGRLVQLTRLFPRPVRGRREALLVGPLEAR